VVEVTLRMSDPTYTQSCRHPLVCQMRQRQIQKFAFGLRDEFRIAVSAMPPILRLWYGAWPGGPRRLLAVKVLVGPIWTLN
jgi:hypothetical protein